MAIATVSFFLYQVFVNPLPSDEELIAHFQSHRTEIEELVRLYREYERPPGEKPRYWAATPKVEQIMLKAGVKWVNQTGALWLSDPYSSDTAKKVDAIVRSPGAIRLYDQHGAVYVRLADARYSTSSLRYPASKAIWKELYHIPVVAKIENGTMLGPLNLSDGHSFSSRALAALNAYPSDWKQGECVVRRIDGHWFIRMCRAS